jgi:putative endonuclease
MLARASIVEGLFRLHPVESLSCHSECPDFGRRNPYRRLECRRVPASLKVYFVYILSSLSRTLYVGVSNNVQRRSAEHWIGKADSFTTRYKIDRLVYFETFSDVVKAIAREKQIKNWRREKKIALINSMNPSWGDLRKTLLVKTLL